MGQDATIRTEINLLARRPGVSVVPFPEGAKIFLFSVVLRRVLEPAQPPIQWRAVFFPRS
jgi:hypothetical protein